MQRLASQDAILAGHCPLTGRYFKPCKVTPIRVNTLARVTARKGGMITPSMVYTTILKPPTKIPGPPLLCLLDSVVSYQRHHNHLYIPQAEL